MHPTPHPTYDDRLEAQRMAHEDAVDRCAACAEGHHDRPCHQIGEDSAFYCYSCGRLAAHGGAFCGDCEGCQGLRIFEQAQSLFFEGKPGRDARVVNADTYERAAQVAERDAKDGTPRAVIQLHGLWLVVPCHFVAAEVR